MIVIIGLGNPGEKYRNNRHNIGFMFVDYIGQEFKFEKYSKSEISKISVNGKDVLLAKPQTFMNKSGESVKKIIDNFKLKIENVIIVHDDLDIPLGKFKIQKGTGPHLHNGLESIENYLKTKDYWRIRIGVDARLPDRWIDGESYVLQNFLDDEIKKILALFPEIIKRLQTNMLE